MRDLQYISYAYAHRIAIDELITVDCHYPRGLVLGHLYHDRVPEALRANTSTATVMNWLTATETEQRSYLAAPSFVTCNHWDIDGFLAVWSLLNPSIALRYRTVLEAAAMLGDFREFDPYTEKGIAALKICALLNRIESATFCLPFADLLGATIEYEVAEKKFQYFLPRFAQWLERIEEYSILWQNEFNEVLQDFNRILAKEVRVENHEALGLSIIRTTSPLHYYAAFSAATCGAVLTIIEGHSYLELEYKYETRVGRTDRPQQERHDLSSLAKALTHMEHSPGIQWKFDNIHEGGPMLRPELVDHPVSHVARYQNMRYRLEANHPHSSIPPTEVVQLLQQEFTAQVSPEVAQ